MTTKLDEDHRVKLLLKPERRKLATAMVNAMLDASYLHGLFRCCLNCQYFDEDGSGGAGIELCTLANPPSRPPARVIVTGCPGHSDNVPF